MRSVVRSAPFWLLLIVLTTPPLFGGLATTQHTLYLTERGFSADAASALLGIGGVLAASGRVLFGLMADRVGAPTAGFVSLGFTFLGLACLLGLEAWPAPLLAYGYTLFLFLPMGSRATIGSVLVGRIAPPAHYGVVFGLLGIGNSLGSALGPFLAGALHDWTGSYTLIYACRDRPPGRGGRRADGVLPHRPGIAGAEPRGWLTHARAARGRGRAPGRRRRRGAAGGSPASCVVDDPIVFEGRAPARIRRALLGRRVRAVRRHGKHFWLELDRRPWLCVHFGMAGGLPTTRRQTVRLRSSRAAPSPGGRPASRGSSSSSRTAASWRSPTAAGSAGSGSGGTPRPSRPIAGLGFDALRRAPAARPLPRARAARGPRP